MRRTFPWLALASLLLGLLALFASGASDSTLMDRARRVHLPIRLTGSCEIAWQPNGELTVIEETGRGVRVQSVDVPRGAVRELEGLNRQLASWGAYRSIDEVHGEWVMSARTVNSLRARKLYDLSGRTIAEIPPDVRGNHLYRAVVLDGRLITLYGGKHARIATRHLVTGETRVHRSPGLDDEDLIGFTSPETFVSARLGGKDPRAVLLVTRSLAPGTVAVQTPVRLPVESYRRPLLSPDRRRLLWHFYTPAPMRSWIVSALPALSRLWVKGDTCIVMVSRADGSDLREVARHTIVGPDRPATYRFAWKPDSHSATFTLADDLYEFPVP